MQPGKKSLKLYKGATDVVTFWIKDSAQNPVNLTGAIITAYVATGSSRIELTMGNGIVVTPVEGKTEIVIDGEAKEPLSGKGGWSAKIEWPSGIIDRIIEGKVEVIPEP